jgi:hypothetical protein
VSNSHQVLLSGLFNFFGAQMDKETHSKYERDNGLNQQFNSGKLPANVTFLGQLITPSKPKVILGTNKKIGAPSLIKLGQKSSLVKGETSLSLRGPYCNETCHSL